MMKCLLSCAFMASALWAGAYNIQTAVSIEGDNRWYFDVELLDNDVDFTAFQLDVTLDGAHELSTADLEKGVLLGDHTLAIGTPDGHYRVLGYSMTNSNLTAQNGRVFSFTVDGAVTGITINKVIFVTADGTEVEAAPYVAPLDRNDEDALQATQADRTQNVIYDTTGRQVYRVDRRGIYIQNGRKVTK